MAQADSPTLVFADEDGQIMDAPDVRAVCRVGRRTVTLDRRQLIPLPPGAELFMLPGRRAMGINAGQSEPEAFGDVFAVAVALPPGHSALSLAAYLSDDDAPMLPLFSYAAVCWFRDQFHVAARRVESDSKHDPTMFSPKGVRRRIRKMRERYPGNPLIDHLADNCAVQYECANARNLFYERWECPVPLTAACNAACVGCISEQPDNPIPSPQDRLGFVPKVEDILEFVVPHLQNAERAMVSFGQGCEGEPLLQADLMEEVIRRIRKETDQGTIHLNTNGSRPKAVLRLCDAGLDSIRVSLNSAQPEYYERYYRPRVYGLNDVVDTIRIARENECYTSINYLSFPGFTDSRPEFDALCAVIEETGLNMIQWRNLNIDPDLYAATIELPDRIELLGMSCVFRELHELFPNVRHGYVNPPREEW